MGNSMAFVRTKTIKGHKYYYLVENIYEDGKTRQRTIVYLGIYSTLSEAVSWWEQLATRGIKPAARAMAKAKLEKVQPYLYSEGHR